MNEGRKYTLSKSAEDMKIGEVADIAKGFAVIQQEVGVLLDRKELLGVQQRQVLSLYT